MTPTDRLRAALGTPNLQGATGEYVYYATVETADLAALLDELDRARAERDELRQAALAAYWGWHRHIDTSTLMEALYQVAHAFDKETP